MSTNTTMITGSRSVTVTAEDLLSEVQVLQKALDNLRTKIQRALQTKEPKYGSDAWWKKSNRESREQYKRGEYLEIKTKEELNGFFDKLKMK